MKLASTDLNDSNNRVDNNNNNSNNSNDNNDKNNHKNHNNNNNNNNHNNNNNTNDNNSNNNNHHRNNNNSKMLNPEPFSEMFTEDSRNISRQLRTSKVKKHMQGSGGDHVTTKRSGDDNLLAGVFDFDSGKEKIVYLCWD